MSVFRRVCRAPASSRSSRPRVSPPRSARTTESSPGHMGQAIPLPPLQGTVANNGTVAARQHACRRQPPVMNSTGRAQRPPPYSVLRPRHVSMRIGPRSPQHRRSRRTTPSSTIVTSGRARPPSASPRTTRSVRRTSEARNVNPSGVSSTVLRRSSFTSAERFRLRTEWTVGCASPRTQTSHPIPRLMGGEQCRASSILRCRRLPVPGVLQIWRQL